MNWKTWLKGLAAAHAVVGGQVNKGTAVMAGFGAISTVLAYRMQSPVAQSVTAETLDSEAEKAMAVTGQK